MQKEYADQHWQDISYQVGDLVLLSTKNLSFAGSKKFYSHFMVSFTAPQPMGTVAVRLELSIKLHKHHPVFHASLLCRYLPGGDGVEPLAPMIVEDVDEHESEALIAHW